MNLFYKLEIYSFFTFMTCLVIVLYFIIRNTKKVKIYFTEIRWTFLTSCSSQARARWPTWSLKTSIWTGTRTTTITTTPKNKNFAASCMSVLTPTSTFFINQSKKFLIEKAIKQVFHVYPNFDTDILQFSKFVDKLRISKRAAPLYRVKSDFVDWG